MQFNNECCNVMKRILLLMILCCTAFATHAQKMKDVKGEATYFAREDESKEKAKQKALERAKINALEREFGTTVSQYNTIRMENVNGRSTSNFSSIGETEVKGEWIGDTKKPEYKIEFVDGVLVVTCRVWGQAREITGADIDLQFHILRNGTEERFESTDFRSGDDLYLSFQSPVSGYLAVYLVDAENQAFCLLPYRGQNIGIYPIEANRHYVFFNERLAPAAERSFVDEYTMTCERNSEQNHIYVIFSPNQFTKALDLSEDIGLPRQLSQDDFNQWRIKCRKRDKEMTSRPVTITISKK